MQKKILQWVFFIVLVVVVITSFVMCIAEINSIRNYKYYGASYPIDIYIYGLIVVEAVLICSVIGLIYTVARRMSQMRAKTEKLGIDK